MKPITRIAFAGLVGAALVCGVLGRATLQAETPKEPPKSKNAWTLDEALEALQLAPRDAYLQYVVLQLARREGKLDEVVGKIESLSGGGEDRAARGNQRHAQADLFSMFAGALAVQESLQLDTMRGPPVKAQPETQPQTPDAETLPMPKEASDEEAAEGEQVQSSPEELKLPPQCVPATNEEGDGKIHTRRSELKFPIQIDERARPTLQEVRLYVHTPSGQWCLAATASPSDSCFKYTAAQDGEYWFSVVTVDQNGRATPLDVTMEAPGLKVVVDTSTLVPELLSAPKEVPEETSASQTKPPLPTGWYTHQQPQYIPPTPEYPLPRETTNLQLATATQPTPSPPPSSTEPPAATTETAAPAPRVHYRTEVQKVPYTTGPNVPRTSYKEIRRQVVVVADSPATENEPELIPPPKEVPNATPATVRKPQYRMVVKEVHYTVVREVPYTRVDSDGRQHTAYKTVSQVCCKYVHEKVLVSADSTATVSEPETIPPPKEAPSGPENTQPTPASLPPPPTPEEVTPPPDPEAPATKEETDKAEREKQVAADKRRKEIVKVSTLKGPEVKSHPWETMLGDKQPAVSHLSRCVPADFYLVEFRSLTKLLDLIDTADQWGTFIYNQSVQDARNQRVGLRVQTQLAVETNRLLRPFYDLVVEEVAVTGSDLFIREGSDVTLLFRVKQEKLFKERMEKFLANAMTARPDATRSTGHVLGVSYVHVGTPDRAVSVYAAYPEPGLHVRSNSKVALRRVLEAIQGKAVERLGDTAEFKYIRTLMPRGASEEDGFVYLSDPFIRHMVSPQLKLTERHRLLAYNHLRMIGHAAQMYRTENGKAAASLDELAAADCCPGKFNEGELTAPDRGYYSLAADGSTGSSSRHGTIHFLTPCCEIPVKKVHGNEADEYNAFLEEYNTYWKTYFDPIALRVQVGEKRVRFETIVLPLIDSSIYTTLTKIVGGKEEHLDALPVPKRNLFSVNVRLNREELLKGVMKELCIACGDPGPAIAEDLAAMPWGGVAGAAGWCALNEQYQALKTGVDVSACADLLGLGLKPEEAKGFVAKCEDFLLRGVGSQVGLHVYDQGVPFDLNLATFLGQMLGTFNGPAGGLGAETNLGVMAMAVPIAACTAPGYIAIPVEDGKVVDDFLDSLDKVVLPLVRKAGSGLGLPIEMDAYKVQLKDKVNAHSFAIRFGPARFRIHWARIGKGLYITNQVGVLEDLQAATAEQARLKARDLGPKAHAMVRMRARNWDQALPGFRMSWAENNRQACLANLGPLSSAARALTAAPPGQEAPKTASWDDREVRAYADRLYGTHHVCPEGGRYVVSPDGKTVTCTLHGSVLEPRQRTAPPAECATSRLMADFADLTAALTFTEEGLRAVVTIDRK